MKQTAVEWLVEKLSYETSDGTIISHHKTITHLVEQSKAMEKQQIIDAANNFISEWEWDNGETYYNKTFKSE